MAATGSDHCQVHKEMVSTKTKHIKYVKFLYSCVENLYFMDTIKTCLEKEVAGTGMWGFQIKKIKGCQTLLVVGLRKNLVKFSKKLGCMRNKYTMLKKNTSLTKVNKIDPPWN